MSPLSPNDDGNVQKEATAISVMRYMLMKYAEDYQISFEKAHHLFVCSKAYELLFRFETEVWKEGPDYLRDLFEEEMGSKTVLNKKIVQ